jgi:hypothetical protein
VDFTVADSPESSTGCEEAGEEPAALCHEARLVQAVNNLFRVPPGMPLGNFGPAGAYR